MATQKDVLFDLIQSLTQNEKRYVKVFSAHASGGAAKAKYLRLFDAMEAEKDYDRAAFEVKYAKSDFVKHLAQNKKYLKDHILKAMRNFHSSRNVNNQLFEMLQDQEFLQQKRIYDASEKVLRKARKLAEKHEKHYMLLEINERERRLAIEREGKKLMETVSSLLRDQKATLNQMLNKSQYFNTYQEFFSSYRSNANPDIYRSMKKDPEDAKAQLKNLLTELDNILESRPFNDPSHAQGFFAQLYRLFLLALHARLSGNFREFRRICEHIVQIWESNPEHLEENRNAYIKNLGNYANALYLVGDYDEMSFQLRKLRDFEPQSLDEEAEIFQNVAFLEFLHAINTRNWKEAETLIPGIQRDLTKYQDKVNQARRLAFLMNMISFYFLNGDFKVVKDMLEEIMDAKELQQREDLRDFARLILPIVYYERELIEIITDRTRATYRQLKKKRHDSPLPPLEKGVLDLLRRLPNFRDSGELRDAAAKCLQMLESESDNGKHPQKTIGMEEVKVWLKSKIENRPITEFR